MPYRINKQTGGMDFVDGITGSVLSNQTVQKPAPAQSGGFFKSITNTLIPRTSNLLKQAKAGLNLSLLTDQEEEDRERRQKLIEDIIGKAKKEADPDRRSQLLGRARDLSAQGSQQISESIKTFEQESGTKIGDKERVMAEALGVAGELGTFILPVGKLAKVGKTGKLVSRSAQIAEATTATQRILQGAKLGGKIGVISAATDPEEKTKDERVRAILKEGGVGLLTGGALSTAFEVPRAAVIKFLRQGSNKATVARLFGMSSANKKKFRKSSGLDFEEEILAREGQSISGMNYDELRVHFQNRTKAVQQELDDILVGSSETINKNKLISSLKSRISSMAPSKGNVGTTSARNQLQGVIDELALLPDDEISLQAANNIKKQLQNMGSAAFSPSGKATTTSDAFAGASTKVKDMIEKAVGGGKANPVKEANKSIQLYRAAKDSIESMGDNQIKKISSGGFQKFLQQISGIALLGGAGGGFGLGGPGGSIIGATLAATMVGGSGAARLKFLSPQVQTKMIGTFSKILDNQGVKNFDSVASNIVREINKQLSRQATLSRPDQVEEPLNLGPEVQQSKDTQIEDQLEPEIQQEADSSTIQQQIDHTPEVPELVTIRNKKTGETKQVKRGQLGEFGLASDSPDSIPGLPSKGEILAAMIIDATKGGKNISKLKTILDAYDQVEGEEAEEKKLSASQQKRLVELERTETTVELVGDLAEKAGVGLTAKAKAVIGKLPGVEGGAEEDLARVTNGLARAIAGTLAGEVGVATDKDIERWKGLMPRVEDTLEERRRTMNRLRSALKSERQRLLVPDDSPLE